MHLTPYATAIFAISGHSMPRPASLCVLYSCLGLPLLSALSPSLPRKLSILQDTEQVLPPVFQTSTGPPGRGGHSASPSSQHACSCTLHGTAHYMQPPSHSIIAHYMALVCSFIHLYLYVLTLWGQGLTYLIHLTSLTTLSTEAKSKHSIQFCWLISQIFSSSKIPWFRHRIKILKQ